MSKELFRTEELSFSLDGKPILRDISLTCPRGGVSFIMGPSGAGKSTLLKLLVRLSEASAGKVFFEGKPIDELSPIALRRKAVYVPQQPSLPFYDFIRHRHRKLPRNPERDMARNTAFLHSKSPD